MTARRVSWWGWCLVVGVGVLGASACGRQPAEPVSSHEHAAADADAPDLATDDVAFLTQLFLTKGHLRVGTALYRQGAVAAADVHMKHPHDELYAELAPALEARGLPGFADELTALAAAVEGRQPIDRVDAALAAANAAIDRVAGIDADPARASAQVVQVIASLMRHAADEYAVGVQGATVVEPQEYQDAWGFTQIALEQTDRLAARGGAAGQTAAGIRTQLEALAPAWPSIVPPDTITSHADSLAAAATAIDAASGGL